MYDVLIIGAGVVGSSIARELSKYELNICVIEKNSDICEGTTKANSAIIHAGFDAKPGSLKAKLNVEGNKMFDKLSEELDFPFRRIGALVLCFDERDLYKLEDLKKQGEKNGVFGLKVLNRDELKEIEPNVTENAAAALYAPTSGIVCPYEMTLGFAENANSNGVEFIFDTTVNGIRRQEGNYIVSTNNGDFEAKVIINAAGVFADEINNMVSENKISIIPRKGEYCLLDREAGNLVSKTIFQLPTAMGKGVLVSPTIHGNLLVGPTAVDLDDKLDLTTTRKGLEEVITKGSLSVKNLPVNKVITSFAGLRAHFTADDFVIGEAEDAEGFINAAGIESPGLSSAPAIAVMIENLVVQKLNPSKNKNFNPVRKGILKFRELSNEEKNKLIKSKAEYGRIVCRCETVTEGEIIDAIRRPLGAKTVDGVKRRTRAGTGRCQVGFCMTKTVELLARELKIGVEEVTKFGGNSKLLVGKNKDSIK
ncbi:NAD(P)/FAD-dependent oxidoreductase [Clostridium sp. SYSU_GA19001]|uniref:NAD(P)/FAD-dependent oxidoreductase n=1 Tax=Clostridium caldaquaticum TaxID=2940653 RepID=UPI002077364C|nr:NAD(P)/FAD-dependent oxidoreductase [Clostridium caldaquaticum]MCM8711418.1 NAD(P)/FAD-dependent oxidoreductase [Clostridium caldaquaticum]